MSKCCGSFNPNSGSSGGAALPAGNPGGTLVFDGSEWVSGSVTRIYEWQALAAGNSTAIRWLHVAGSSVAASTTEVVSYRELQISGRARKLRISLFSAMVTNITLTWRLNTILQNSLLLLAGQMNADVAFDTPVLAGDLISMQSVTAAADAAQVGIRAYLLVDTP